jgi:chemotaxis protein methyltransferase CheR
LANLVLELNLDDMEVESMFEQIYNEHGFDFRQYAMPTLKRQIQNTLKTRELSSVADLHDRVCRDPEFLKEFVSKLTMPVTSMFRDPSFFLAFRKQVIPLLRAYPFIRIWHAGCCTGQEVYSMAILLMEEGLYSRCRLYGTDMNPQLLHIAKQGIYPAKLMKDYTQAYLQAGGTRSFSEYYTAAYDHAILRPSLRENIVFAQHNLVNDHIFNEFNVVLCRNVLIYFNRLLRERVLQLFYDSLCPLGILGLGRHETLVLSPYEKQYDVLSKTDKLYRRRN